MVSCLKGGGNFLVKSLPVNGISANFLEKHISETTSSLNEVGVDSVALICDGNRTNQRFFKNLSKSKDEKWLAENGQFLLYDYVHLLKSIRNNWINEPTGQCLKYFILDDNFKEVGQKFAYWSHIEELYDAEQNKAIFNLKESDLIERAVFPKRIDRQNVEYAQKVFSLKTACALETFAERKADINENFNPQPYKDTAQFIKIVERWWSICNNPRVGSVGSQGGEIRNANDPRLHELIKFAEMAKLMTAAYNKGIGRALCLTKDTGGCIHQTFHGIPKLVEKLLVEKMFDFVSIKKFNTDPLEKYFSKIRQGAGGAYFLGVQQILEKLNIFKTKYFTRANKDADSYLNLNLPDWKHECEHCHFTLRDSYPILSALFDCLDLFFEECKTHKQFCSTMVYLAGFIMKVKTDELENKEEKTNEEGDESELELLDCTKFYYRENQAYFDKLNKGFLSIPDDSTFEFASLVFIFFDQSLDIIPKLCRKSCMNIIKDIRAHHDFHVTDKQVKVITNIMFSNFVKNNTPKSEKEINMKIEKLKADKKAKDLINLN